jgi:hypothetical protein
MDLILRSRTCGVSKDARCACSHCGKAGCLHQYGACFETPIGAPQHEEVCGLPSSRPDIHNALHDAFSRKGRRKMARH